MSAAVFQAGSQRILYDADRLPAVSFEWLDPEFWRLRSAVVAELGGRGQALQVNTPAGPAVLRQYRRGGLVAGFVRDRYVFLGHERSRSFREWRVLAALRERGLPVPAPLIALSARSGPTGTAAIMTALIPEARGLDAVAGTLDRAGWVRLGQTLARFFRAGVRHADLNATNILVDRDGDWHLIDFDRAQLADKAVNPDPMLRRLFRSFEKLGIRADRKALMQGFESG